MHSVHKRLHVLQRATFVYISGCRNSHTNTWCIVTYRWAAATSHSLSCRPPTSRPHTTRCSGLSVSWLDVVKATKPGLCGFIFVLARAAVCVCFFLCFRYVCYFVSLISVVTVPVQFLPARNLVSESEMTRYLSNIWETKPTNSTQLNFHRRCPVRVSTASAKKD